MTGFTNIQDPEIQKRLFTEKRQRINALYTERNIWLTSQEYKEKFVACEPTNFPNVMEKQWFMLYYSSPKNMKIISGPVGSSSNLQVLRILEANI